MSDPRGTPRNRAWDNEEKFVVEMSQQWGHEVTFGEESVPSPRSIDASHRCILSLSGVPYAVLGSSGTGSDPIAARGSAIKNFMQRLKTSYIPNEVYATVRTQGTEENPYTADVIGVLNLLLQTLQEDAWKPLFAALGTPSADAVTPAHKTLAKSALASVRPKVHEFWRLRGLFVGPPSPADLKKAQKRAAELLRAKNGETDTNEEPEQKRMKTEDNAAPNTVAVAEQAKEVQNEQSVITVSDDSDAESDDDDIVEVDASGVSLNTSSGPPVSSAASSPITSPVSAAKTAVRLQPSTSTANLNGLNFASLLGVTCHNKQAEQWMQQIRKYREQHKKEFETLDEKVMRHYRVNRQNDKVYQWKMKVRQMLCQEIQQLFPQYPVRIYAVGSTVNGCGSYNSDMDLCLCLQKIRYDHNGAQSLWFDSAKGFAVSHLRSIFKCLRYKSHFKSYIKDIQFISSAKVPIIKMEMAGEYEGLEIDVNVNNVAGIYNSHLVHYYSRADDRFPALCLLVKHWAITNDINDAMTGTFNSYSLILLVAHFLQCGVSPPVLPNLQYLYKRKFGTSATLDELTLFEDLEPPLPEFSRNTASVGELLVGFFHYYANFNFDADAVSVREGRRFPRSSLSAETVKFKVYVEEPFDRGNTARCVTKPDNFKKIRAAFSMASKAFAIHPPDLNNINVEVPSLPSHL